MSARLSFERPVLVYADEFKGVSENAQHRGDLYIDEIQSLLEAKLAEDRDYVSEAVGLLLTRSAVSIAHVDISKTRESYSPDDDSLLYDYSQIPTIGFNDNAGGSESDHKILLNGSPAGDRDSYVLYSPPNQEGNPTNLTFRRCDFTFMSWEPKGSYGKGAFVPNPLKTGGIAGYTGRNSYSYYLFGDQTVPGQVYRRFADAGFDFADTPYSSDFDDTNPNSTWTIRGQGVNLGYRASKFWPADQFADQLARIGVETPKFSPDDYPLVRPENAV